MDYEKNTKINPVELARYLHNNGWVARESNLQRIFYTLIQTDETFEAVVFLDESIRDYQTRVDDVLKTLSVVEGRTPQEITAQIVFGTADEWDMRYARVNRLMPTIIRTYMHLTEGISEMENQTETPSTAAKMASMSRLIDQYLDHDTAVLIASYAILKGAGAAE